MGKDIFGMEKEEILTSTYELTLLVSPDLSEFDAQKVVDKVKNMITSRDGQIIKEHNWGKKRLAYPIKKTDSGYYQTIIFTAPKEAINEVTRDMLLVPEILRYLSISLDKEGVVIDQLFTPEKEVALIASMMKEKTEPTKTRITRRTPRTIKSSSTTPTDVKITMDKQPKEPEILISDETPHEEPAEVVDQDSVKKEADDTDRLKVLDEKLDQIFKEE
ncbi:30S ribosomal protein S6 [Patescibacteria group bacterium]|nr:30S ribosomal protein S6 [Patescibacteria group bacterium]